MTKTIDYAPPLKLNKRGSAMTNLLSRVFSAATAAALACEKQTFRARPHTAGIAFALALGATTPAQAHTASVNSVAGLKAAILTAQADTLDDTITLTGNITFASAADAIMINVTNSNSGLKKHQKKQQKKL